MPYNHKVDKYKSQMKDKKGTSRLGTNIRHTLVDQQEHQIASTITAGYSLEYVLIVSLYIYKKYNIRNCIKNKPTMLR